MYLSAHVKEGTQLPALESLLPYPPKPKPQPKRELTEGQKQLLAQCHKAIAELEG